MEGVLEFLNSFEDGCSTDPPISSERDNYDCIASSLSTLPTPMWPTSPSLSTSSSILLGSAEDDSDHFTSHNIDLDQSDSRNRPMSVNHKSGMLGKLETNQIFFSNASCNDEMESYLMENSMPVENSLLQQKSNTSCSFNSDSCDTDQNRSLYSVNEMENKKAKINPVTIYLGNSSRSSAGSITEQGRRSYCLGDSNSKNAIAARDNRLKKKRYISDLEDTVKHLKSTNAALTKEAQMSKAAVLKLQEEVSYLRSVIANETVLSSLLKNVLNTPGVNVSTSFKFNDYEKKEKRKASSSISLPDSTSMQQNSSHKKKTKKSDKSRRVSIYPSGRILRSSSNCAHQIQRHGIENQRLSTTIKDVHAQRMFHPVDNSSETDSDEGKDGEEPENTAKPLVVDKSSDEPGGVCLHVSGHSVSLEFCAHCSINAKSGVMNDHSYVKF